MARTFVQYQPKVLTLDKLTPEQKAKVPAGEKIRFGLNRVRQKNGDIYVLERAYYIVPETNKPRAIASVKIGTIPKGQEEMISTIKDKEPKPAKKEAMAKFSEKAQDVLQDDRQPGKIAFPLDVFWATCLLCAVTGRTDASSIADYWNTHKKALFRGYDSVSEKDISSDTVLRLMSLLTVEHSIKMARFFCKKEEELPNQKNIRIIAMDGQSIRAARTGEKRCGHLLNLFDCTRHRFIGQFLIDAKESEVTRAPDLLAPYDLDGTIVTADALFSKASMFEAIINKGADYCIPVKDNTKLVKSNIDSLFTEELNKENETKIKQIKCEVELEHGRIEQREVYVLPASLLPKNIKDRWVGLEDGCIVQYYTRRIDKKTGVCTDELKRAVTSVRWDTPNVEELLALVLRRHWAIENELHWTLDVAFRQDRIQCKNGKYLYARTWLNKTALNLLLKYKDVTQSDKSIERLMVEMHNPTVALKCLNLSLT